MPITCLVLIGVYLHSRSLFGGSLLRVFRQTALAGKNNAAARTPPPVPLTPRVGPPQYPSGQRLIPFHRSVVEAAECRIKRRLEVRLEFLDHIEDGQIGAVQQTGKGRLLEKVPHLL